MSEWLTPQQVEDEKLRFYRSEVIRAARAAAKSNPKLRRLRKAVRELEEAEKR